jgi:hypothetical protein
MTTVGLAFVPIVFFGIIFYGAIFFCVWKFYQILSKINDNITGIRQALERNGTSGADDLSRGV